jgi:outer membrane receptor protein involved in Fe transport
MNRILRAAIVIMLLCLPGIALAQGSGIKGNLVDEKGNAIVNANVLVSEGGIPKGRDLTDFDGNYSVKPLSGGRYDVKFSYLGRDLTITNVVLAADQTVTVNGRLSTSNEAIKGGKGVTVTAVRSYVPPIIDPENPGGRSVKTAEQIEKAPTRNTSDIASLSTQVYQGGNGTGLSIGGGRGSGTKYVVDGVQLPPGASNYVNQAPGSVETITTFSSGIPARYGDASGGLVTITTKGATSRTMGSLQYEHSVDGYNSNQLTLNLSGPLLRKKDSFGNRRPIVGYNITADGIYTEDSDPSFTPNYYATEETIQQVSNQPLVVIQDNGNVRSDFATNYLRDSNFTTSKKRKNADFYRGQLAGKLDFNLSENISVRVGASYFATDANVFDRRQSFFAYDDNGKQLSKTGRGYIRFTQKFGNKGGSDDLKENAITNAFYTVQADYQKDYTTTQDKRHGHNTFDYGYVGKFEELYTPDYRPGIDELSGVAGIRLRGYIPSSVIFTPSDKNPELANYTKQVYQYLPFQPPTQLFITGARGLRNGEFPANVYGMYRNPGYGRGGWNESNNDQVSIGIDASFDLKQKKTTHSVEFGLYYQQRNERFYGITGASNQGSSIWNLMRQLTTRSVNPNDVQTTPFFVKNGIKYTLDDVRNGVINPSPADTIFYERKRDADAASAFDMRLRKKLMANGMLSDPNGYINTDKYDPSFYSLDMFSADDLFNSGNSLVGYRGYTYDGKLVNGNVNFNDFWTEQVTETDINGNPVKYFTRPIAAYRPNYIAGYLSDYIQYKDFRITLGVRVERFDNNTKVLRDPYSLNPVRTVGSYAGPTADFKHPANIGKDYVVYVGGNTVSNQTPQIIGYRNGDTWYDASGREVQDPLILRTGSGAQDLEPFLQIDSVRKIIPDIKDSTFNPDNSFTDYKPAVNVMPRINFSFPLNENALFYAHYDVLYQRPTGASYATQTDYMFLNENPTDIYGNSNLRPERMIDYEVGFQQRLTDRSGITLSGFYKERKDQIQIRPYLYAYPTTYYTYGNRDYSTYKGLSLAYELRRIGNLSLTINYTLSFTEGTGSDAASSNGGDVNRVNGNGVLQQFIASGLPNLRTQFPVTFDSRHNINAQIDYRFAGPERRGPAIGNLHPFENSGIQFLFRARSGEPYTKYATARGSQEGASNSPVIEGTVNGSRLGGHFNLDVNLDKTIPLRFHKVKEGEVAPQSRLGLNIYAYAKNVLNIRDVRGVYGFTGRAGDDGYLTSAQGNSYLISTSDPQSFRDYYNTWQQNPDQIGPPRTVVVGLRLNF